MGNRKHAFGWVRRLVGYPLVAILTLAGFASCAPPYWHPDKLEYTTPEAVSKEAGVPVIDQHFKSADGTKLHGWFLPAKGEAKGTIIHFHGNAQNLTSHISFVSWLPAEGYNVFTMDYRGYGKSEGRPSLAGVFQDCVAAMEHVQTIEGVDANKLILFGQSLGGSNAIAVAGEMKWEGVRAVIVDSTFYSYKTVANAIAERQGIPKAVSAPYILTLPNKHNAGDALAGIPPVPLLVIHGDADEVIPYKSGKKIYDAAGQPKDMWTVKNGTHISSMIAQAAKYRPKLLAYLNKVLKTEEEEEEEATKQKAHPVVLAARTQIGQTIRYDGSYVRLDYPGGDVPRSTGVCTDVVIRALRDGRKIDLQKEVHEDMKANFGKYPPNWGLSRPDKNIDHRRVPNLRTYFTRQGASLPLRKKADAFLPGDLVTCMVGNRPHIMIVSDRRAADGTPLVIHNIGRGTQEENRLFAFKLTGHYRVK